MLGTPDFMAPEQALDFHEVSHAADIYSLGCTFYYLLTGQPPFPGGSLAQKLLRHQQAQPQPITMLRPDVPPRLGPIIARMLAKCPEDRPATVGGVAEQLAQLGPGGLAGTLVGWLRTQAVRLLHSFRTRSP
jgi:serine/threonine-protein kinase